MAFVQSSHLQLTLTLIVASIAVTLSYGLISLLRRHYRLRHIPGPFWSKWTDLGLIARFRSGTQTWPQIAIGLDKKYGPVVTYGPNRVLFSDISASPVIYGTTNAFPKADSYDIPVPIINGKLSPSIVSVRDEKVMTQLRRHLNPKFTTNAMVEYEHHIDETLDILITQLGRSPTTNLQDQLSYFSFDTICRLAFSDDPNSMTKGQDVGNTLQGGRDRFLDWYRWFTIPGLDALIRKNPLFRSSSKPAVLTQMAVQRVQDRLAKGGAGDYNDLLDRYFQGRAKDPSIFTIPMITGITLSTIHAGSETTAHTLSHFFWCLFQNPDAYEKVKTECRNADLTPSPKWTDVKKLHYLEAAIKESQRQNVLIPLPTERVVPPSGATIAGAFIPGGTIVSINAHALSINPSIYDPYNKYPVDAFHPERWLNATDTQKAVMERASMAFSQGKRTCLGLHMAWAEMLKAVPRILRTYDVKLEDPEYQIQYEQHMMKFVKELPVRVTPRIFG